MELSHHLVKLFRATNEEAWRKLMVRTLLLDYTNIFRVVADCLEHTAHATNEHDLLFENLAATSLDLDLLLSLLVKHSLYVLSCGVWSRNLICTALPHQLLHHVANLLDEEGHTPLKEVHALWQVERMLDIFVLLDVHFIILNQDNRTFVIVFTAVVWRAKNCNDGWEGSMTTPSVHLVSVYLNLMGANDGDEVVCPQNVLDRVQTEFNGTLTLRVRAEAHLARVAVIHWIRPKQVTKETLERRLLKSIHILDITSAVQLW